MSVLVRDSEGRTTSRYPLPVSGEFEIEYVHSYYQAPAVEHFVAEEDGSFELFGVSSPSEAVLDYYELEGRKEKWDDLLRLLPGGPQSFETLPLIATEKGRRTLVVSGERIPLYEEGGLRRVTIQLEEDALSTELRELLEEWAQELTPMARIDGIDPDRAEKPLKAVLEAQTKKWGAPLLNYLIYARRPSIFRGARGMWSELDSSGLVDPKLVALINRRIATLNGCVFWQDINAAVGSELGVSEEKILALDEYAASPLYDEKERVALEYADAITLSNRDVSDELFSRVRRFFDDALVELTAVTAWENSSSKFNRALRVVSQGLWKRDKSK
jgi:alkylhydroperoxidase family enzyme